MSPWEPGPRLLGNLYIIIWGTLTTFTWKTWEPCREPWRNLEGTFWEPFGKLEGTLRNLGNLEGTLGTLGTFTWEPLLGNLYLEPGNLGGMGFGAAPVCSETFTMAEDPKAFCCWGMKESNTRKASPKLATATQKPIWGTTCHLQPWVWKIQLICESCSYHTCTQLGTWLLCVPERRGPP